MQALKRYYRVLALPLFEDNYSYIVAGTAKRNLVLVDPANPVVILKFLSSNFPQHTISHVLYTHKHWDHAGGSQYLAQQLKLLHPDVKIVIGEHDRQFVKGSNYPLVANQELTIGSSIVRTLHVPCHTRGHTIYTFLPQFEDFDEEYKIAQTTQEGKKIRVFSSHSCTFTGDTLFVGGIGRFFEGNAAQMAQNIQNIFKTIDLDSDIFCGHEYALANLKWGIAVEKNNKAMRQFYDKLIKDEEQGSLCSIPSTLRRERQINIFVRAVTGSPLQDEIEKNPAELMKILREMKNKNITDVQLGKNL